MLISFACMSEKVPGETCLPFSPEEDLFVAEELSWAGPYLESPALSLGGNFGGSILLLCLSALWGGPALSPVPPPFLPHRV